MTQFILGKQGKRHHDQRSAGVRPHRRH